MLRQVLVAASRSDGLRHVATELPAARRVAMRFVAGEHLEDALRVTRELNAAGMSVSLDHLGEAVDDPTVARETAQAYRDALAALDAGGLDGAISVKLTSLGLDVDRDLCHDLVGEVCTAAAAVGRHVTIDMEGSAHTQRTVDLVVALREEGHANVGCAVQAYLRRTATDVERLVACGASLRLCKGAYAEPPELAFPSRREVSANFVDLAEVLLRAAPTPRPRIATHDHRLIARTRNLAVRHGIAPDAYEFQMLYGVREPLQREVVAAGHPLRIYVPYGARWYPYFVRRIAERPANLAFFLRALAGPRAD